MTKDRRRHERFVIDAPVSVATDEVEVEGRVHDLSANGTGVEFLPGTAMLRLEVGDRVTLKLPDGTAQSGHVVRQYEGGFGMLFDRSDEDVAAGL